jgi:2-polyprenyl-6-methoxyphenol hydroxylase-like FAD-dependent oxidoreductase
MKINNVTSLNAYAKYKSDQGKTNTTIYDVAIIGAGPAGLVAAKSLKDKGYRVIVYEKHKSLKNNCAAGGAFLLLPNGVQALKAAGLGHIIETLDVSINYSSTFAKDGTQLVSGSLHQDGEFYSQAGESFYTFCRSDFVQLLATAIEQEGIKIVYDHACDKIDETSQNVRIHFTNGNEICAKYVLGTDGAHSIVQSFINPHSVLNKIDYAVYCGIFEENFTLDLSEFGMKSDHMFSHFGDDLSLWLCPIANGRQCFYIHVRIAKQEFERWDDKWGLLQQLSSIWYQSPLAKKVVDNIFAQGRTEHSFAGLVQERPPTGPWISASGRIALGGDSTCVHGPKFGAGFTRSILNAIFFSECLENNALHVYQELSQELAKIFYQLEKDEQAQTLTHDKVAINKRNEEIIQSAGRTPLFQGLVPVLKRTSIDTLKNQLYQRLKSFKGYAKL